MVSGAEVKKMAHLNNLRDNNHLPHINGKYLKAIAALWIDVAADYESQCVCLPFLEGRRKKEGKQQRVGALEKLETT